MNRTVKRFRIHKGNGGLKGSAQRFYWADLELQTLKAHEWLKRRFDFQGGAGNEGGPE